MLLSIAAISLQWTEASQAAPAKNGWVRVITDESNNVWYLDKGSMQGRGRFRYFWVYFTLGTPLPMSSNGRMLDSGAIYLSLDCQQKQYRTRFVQLLDQNAKVIDEADVSRQSTADRLMPGDTIGAAIVKYACSQRR